MDPSPLPCSWAAGLLSTVVADQTPRAPARKPAAAPTVPSPTAPPKPATPAEPWRTWGGPRANFTSAATGLAEAWPDAGPPRLWTRALGDGYSGISEEDGVLCTAYRRGSNDVVIAIVWQHDLYQEYGGTRLGFGYSSHALPYKDTLIVLVGGRAGLLSWITGGTGAAAIAFKQRDGAVAWQNLSFDNAHSSPMLITVDGQPQVVALLANEVIGFSPADGAELWRHPHATNYGLAISTPVWGPDNILFVSSAYGCGSRALELHQTGGRTTVRELWATPRLQLHFGNAIRVGDYIYMSDGHNGPAILTAVEVKTGRAAWQRRNFAKAQLLHADGKLILLDEDGTLALTTATPQALEVLSHGAAAEEDGLVAADPRRHAPLRARPGVDRGARPGRPAGGAAPPAPFRGSEAAACVQRELMQDRWTS